ncbi:MAG: HlyD family efflux transporter periplasmic adaptor subunit [Leptolyngbyaceae cyanobacterium SM1_1_3]|nr:HlyD family efflux transporter periplasmic adaptor subunit [Leptolyngbyaceae cyanobacterium SM1_1_3]NJN04511.1 HlyD family efflux transporter periplasmic adaptor subunit [Leptolyngbyaceae cyanobacterium RM1_1_2]NJO11240.1 HlyD family efflux transporter periplasmic adaptor subunit [Leptolyngbyaceae cyanobacterium SL_1_1]
MSINQTQGPFKQNFWLLIGALIFVGGIAFWTARSLLVSRQAALEEQAAPPPQQVSVAALGRIEPQGQVVDVAASESGRLSQVLVAEGDRVAVGQILAYLDLYEVRLAERDLAASQLEEAQSLLQAETAAGAARIQEAQTRYQQADQPQTYAVEAQAATVKSLEAEISLARTDLRRFRQLYQQGAIARQELDQRQTEVNRLQEELNSALATRSRLESNRGADLNNAQAQMSSAQAGAQLAQVQTQVESAAQNLAVAEARLAQTVIRAPQSGQILDVLQQPGEAVGMGDPLMVMGNTQQMFVVAEVYETDVGLVAVGQSAEIISRNGAFESALSGTVAQVGLQIFKNDILDDDPAANADARVVEVRLRIDPGDSETVTGLTNLQVDVVIDVADEN